MAGTPAARPSSPIPFFRDLGTIIPYTTNSAQSKELTRGMVWRELYVRLQGQLTCTGGNNTAANTLPGDEWAVVHNVTLRLNGRDIYKQISGRALRWLQYYLYGEFPRKSLGTVGDGSTANPSFDSSLILPFWMPRSSSPMDFAFDTSQLSRLELEIQWGTHTDINSAATGFTVNPTVATYVYEVANVGGAFARWNIFPISNAIAGAQNKYQFRIPVGYMYRSFLIYDQSAVITNAYLESQPTQWLGLPIQVVRDKLGVDRRNSIVPGAFANTFYLAGAPGDDLTHFIYLDFVGHGDNLESIDSYGLSDLFLEFDVSGAGTVNVFPSQLVVPRG